MREIMTKVRNLLRAKTEIIYIVSHEEDEVLKDIKQIVRDEMSSYKLKLWSGTSGLKEVRMTKLAQDIPVDGTFKDIHRVMDRVSELQNSKDAVKEVFVLRDAHMQLEKIPTAYRAFRDAKESRAENYIPVIIVAPSVYVPVEMEKIVTVVEYDMPTETDVRRVVEKAYQQLVEKSSVNMGGQVLTTYEAPNTQQKDRVVKALLGLTMKEVTRAIKQSIATHNDILIEDILEEKIQLIKKSGVLDYKNPTAKFEEIGGNDAFKEWIKDVELAMSEEAREFGCAAPKGYLALGLPGTSKTYMAEALANKFGMPLIKLDMSRIMNKLVGESEKKIDQAFRVAKACAPCIMLWDEIEKILGGVKSSNSSDAGTTSRIFASCLQFLQEDNGVFVVMTSNDVSQLPPELTRSGRLDAMWYFTLPTEAERESIYEIHLNKTGKAYDKAMLHELAAASDKYTGAEIENIVKSAVWKAFRRFREDGVNEILVDDILSTIPEIIPIYKSSKEKVTFLDNWVKGRARYSSDQIVDENGFYLEDDDDIDLELDLED